MKETKNKNILTDSLLMSDIHIHSNKFYRIHYMHQLLSGHHFIVYDYRVKLI